MLESKIIQLLHHNNSLQLDDCYFMNNKYLVTTDTISENTHFKHEWSSAKDLAEKIIEVNVSDIAASGGLPKFAFLNLGLSEFSKKEKWISSFLRELKRKLNFYKIKLAGGDTYKSPHTNLTLTLIGYTQKPIFRSTGKPNEYLYTTGSLGLSYLGYLHLLNNTHLPTNIKKEAINKHLRPKSRLSISQKLIHTYKISAMMDITDGIAQDSAKLALASNLEIHININKFPRFTEFSKYLQVDEIISSGEELELLFLSKEKIEWNKEYPITCIGETRNIVNKAKSVFYLNGKKYKPKTKGFLHFV